MIHTNFNKNSYICKSNILAEIDYYIYTESKDYKELIALTGKLYKAIAFIGYVPFHSPESMPVLIGRLLCRNITKEELQAKGLKKLFYIIKSLFIGLKLFDNPNFNQSTFPVYGNLNNFDFSKKTICIYKNGCTQLTGISL